MHVLDGSIGWILRTGRRAVWWRAQLWRLLWEVLSRLSAVPVLVLVLSMELAELLLIRIFTKVNITLYCQALEGLAPYLIAKNNVNCARLLPGPCWPPAGTCISQCNNCCAQVAPKFLCNCHWPGPRQTHQWYNQGWRRNGWYYWGLFGSRWWMVAGPEISRLVALYVQLQKRRMLPGD